MTRKDLKMDEKVQPQESGTETEGMGSTGITVPGYQSQYAGQIGQLYDQISNRKPFEYNVNADAMYQALKDQYVANGQRAMLDTMGQAQTMTGGYGNSYAQGVGQQAYQGYLQGMTDLIPEYYQMALQNYLQEGDQMLQQYGMLQDLDSMDYNRYMDQMALVQPQVLEMLQNGARPSQEMLAASGLSQEYVDALYPVNTGGGWSPPTVQGGEGGGGGGKMPWEVFHDIQELGAAPKQEIGNLIDAALEEGYISQEQADAFRFTFARNY